MPFPRYSDNGMREKSAGGSKIWYKIRNVMASPPRQKCSGTVSVTADEVRRTALTNELSTIRKINVCIRVFGVFHADDDRFPSAGLYEPSGIRISKRAPFPGMPVSRRERSVMERTSRARKRP